MLERLGVHPLVVHRHTDVGRFARVERDQPTEEGGVLGDHDVARVDQQLGDEVESLLTAVQDQHLVGGARHALVGHPPGDLATKVLRTVRHRVLQ